MKTITLKIIITIAVGIIVSACNSQASNQNLAPITTRTSETVEGAIASSTPIPTNTKEPASTITPTHTTTSTSPPTTTSTTIPSATITSSPTPTISPTTEIVYNQPGFYPKSACIFYHLPRADYNVDFCILSVTINHDGHMIFATSWTTHLPGNKSVRKGPDSGNRAMHMLDNLGNRYDHMIVGGNAAKYVTMKDGDTVTGWFEFPAAQKDATSFTFYDLNQDVSLGPFSFTAPIILTERTELTWYPLTIEYLKGLWKVDKTEAGGILFLHANIPLCEIHEWKTAEVQGKYKNTNILGGISYEIYGWLEEAIGMREYLAVQGIEGYDSDTNPLFRASIPYDDSLQCIFDVSKVLATLKIIGSED